MGQFTPRRFFLFTVVVLGIIALVYSFCLTRVLLANREMEPLNKSEKSIRAVGKAYIQLGYYELKEFYLVSSDKAGKRAQLNKQMDSLWANIITGIDDYRKYTTLKYPSANTLSSVLKAYRQNSLIIRKMLLEKKSLEALNILMYGEHQRLLIKLEGLFEDVGDLLPSQTQLLLKPEKAQYERNMTGMIQIGWVVVVMSALVFVVIQLLFDSFQRKLLVKRLLPLLLLANIVIQGSIIMKPAPRFDAKYRLVKDYNRFINFMSYFNHYTRLECHHVYDSSRLTKKQLEEEMIVYRRSIRQGLRDCRKMMGQRFKKEVSKLRALRAQYFTEASVPSLVYSFRNERATALRLLLPPEYQSDTLAVELAPDEVTYPKGQNAAFIQQFHQGFNKILKGLDKYYEKAPEKLYRKNYYQESYWGGAGAWLLMLAFFFWRFRSQKKWTLYKAKSHFLPKRQLT